MTIEDEKIKKLIDEELDCLKNLMKTIYILNKYNIQTHKVLRYALKPSKPKSKLLGIGLALVMMPIPIISEALGVTLIGAGTLFNIKKKGIKLSEINTEYKKLIKRFNNINIK